MLVRLGGDVYDVVIAGASFAGLAVATQLRGHRVLLVDPKPVGSGQTSACGSIYQVFRYWGLEHVVLQQHDTCYLHTPWHAIPFPSPYPWCTFDYRACCEALYARSGADLLQARVLGWDGERVRTSQGDLEARCVVDASGWRAVLAGSVLGPPDRARMNMGIESIAEVPATTELDRSALHFWYDPAVLRHGMGWAFPRGDGVSIGLGAYARTVSLRQPLMNLLGLHGATPSSAHGTHFPYALRPLTAGPLFVVGDAAGMCLGLTGEGIRPALFFGEICGRILRRVLEGALTLQAGQAAYVAEVQARRGFFDFFTRVQELVVRLPERIVDWAGLLIHNEPLRRWVYDRYWGLTREWSVAGPYAGTGASLPGQEADRVPEGVTDRL
ncbi:MAG: NAD(P)/FAD-dependent oxidoreductase [Anaerolineae bacterium]